MDYEKIKQEALSLPEGDRAALAAKLLDTLSPPGTEISDDEVERREHELESEEVMPLLREEFVHRVREERRK